jgi:hypothetical protein
VTDGKLKGEREKQSGRANERASEARKDRNNNASSRRGGEEHGFKKRREDVREERDISSVACSLAGESGRREWTE